MSIIEYLTGEAMRRLVEIPEGSINAILSFNTLNHMPHADVVLPLMVRILAPGATIFFNISPEQNVSDSPVIDRLNWLQDSGFLSDINPGTVYTMTAPVEEYVLGWIQKPQD